MSDELNPNERLALDAWEPMTPSPGFPDRVLLAVPTARRWFPYVATAVACGAAAAIATIILLQPRPGTAPLDATEVAVAPPVDAAFVPLVVDAWELDAAIQPIIVDGSVLNLPDHFDIEVDAPRSYTIHDRTGEPEVRIVQPCPSLSTRLEMSRDPSFQTILMTSGGLQGAVARLSPGTWWYRITCSSVGTGPDVTTTGQLRIIKDDASRAVVTAPVVRNITVDGMQWRINHTGTIPDLVIPRPPTGTGDPGDLRLHGEGPTPFVMAVTGSSVTVPGSQLADGTYALFFTAGSLTYGKRTDVVIDYDTAAPILQLQRTPTSSPDIMPIRGVVAPGWSVTANSQPMTLDAKRGFTTGRSIASPRLVFRVDHPRYGTHYYISR